MLKLYPTLLLKFVLISYVGNAQYRFNFEVRDSLNQLYNKPVYITQLSDPDKTLKFCQPSQQLANSLKNYFVTKPILAISYEINNRCVTHYYRERELISWPNTVTIYPDKISGLRQLDIKLYDLQGKPVENEFFFYQTANPDQAPDPKANRFDGHRLQTEIVKQYLVLFVRLNDQQTAKYVLDCKTHLQSNLILDSDYNTPCHGNYCHPLNSAIHTYNFFNRL